MKTVEIVEILPTKVWIETDMCGSQHIMIQHEGMNKFQWMTVNYDYAYTSNATNHTIIEKLLKDLGVDMVSVERVSRPLQEVLDEK